MADDQEAPSSDLFERFLALIDVLTPHAIRAAVTLGVPKLLGEGLDTVDELADATSIDPDAMGSLLGVLDDAGLLEREGSTYRLSDLGELMAHPDAGFHLDVHGSTMAMDQAFAGLHHTLRTGEPGYEQVHGQGFWAHLDDDPALGADFDRFMHRTSGWTAVAAESEVWPADGTVIDVGGGDGRFLGDLLRRHPGLRGVLVEQPATAQRAAARFAAQGMGERVDIVEGSFFDPLPAGGDCYVLGHILHDWPDGDATTILGRVRDAVGPDGRVVLVEQVLDRDHLTPLQARSDLLMRVLFGSHERTRDQWAALAASAGLRLEATHPCDGVRMLVELHVDQAEATRADSEPA